MSKVIFSYFAVAISVGVNFGIVGTALAATPVQVKSEVKIQSHCMQPSSLAERVRCRLQLSPEEQVEDTPEVCREIISAPLQQACVTKHQAFQSCWAKPVGDERVACGQQVVGLTRTTDELIRQCNGQRTCQLALQEKVYDLIKFQFSELQHRAGELMSDGVVSLDSTVTAITAIEEQRALFDKANSNRERQQIIFAVRRIWQELVAEAKRAER